MPYNQLRRESGGRSGTDDTRRPRGLADRRHRARLPAQDRQPQLVPPDLGRHRSGRRALDRARRQPVLHDGRAQGRNGPIFGGATMLSAVAVLTWMIFWMRRQAMNIKHELESRLAGAIAAGSSVGLAAVAFFAVLREGWESALFLFAISESSSPWATSVGSVLGLSLSISLGVMIYMGSRRLNLRQFFTVTGLLLIIFAAGLLARGIGEFQEARLLPQTIEHVWNMNGIVSGDSSAGQFLSALFGYNADPSLLQVLVWFGFLSTVLWFFLSPLVSWRKPAPATT